jgi:hypothetical protein
MVDVGSSREKYPFNNKRLSSLSGRSPLYTRTARELAQANGIEIIDVLQKPVSLARLCAALKHVPPCPSR